jgi:hypothetical protein
MKKALLICAALTVIHSSSVLADCGYSDTAKLRAAAVRAVTAIEDLKAGMGAWGAPKKITFNASRCEYEIFWSFSDPNAPDSEMVYRVGFGGNDPYHQGVPDRLELVRKELGC